MSIINSLHADRTIMIDTTDTNNHFKSSDFFQKKNLKIYIYIYKKKVFKKKGHTLTI